MSTRRRRRFVLIALFLGVLIGARFALNPLVGALLIRVFANGTGCEVSANRSSLTFFPLSAEIRDVVIRHPSEPPDHGFRAERVSIRLAFLPLLRREVRFDNMRLDGASAFSVGSETGFRNTMAFLFPPPPKSPPAPTRIGQFLKTFDFHVTGITIETPSRPGRQFLFEQEGVRVEAEQVELSFIEQDADSKKPYDFDIGARNVTAKLPEIEELSLGELKASTVIGLGNFVIKSAHVSRSDYPHFTADFTAEVGLREPHNLHVRYSIKSAVEFLRTLPQIKGTLPKGDLAAVGEVSGRFSDPSLDTTIDVRFDRVDYRLLRAECMVESLRARVKYQRKTLEVSDISVDDVGGTGYFTVFLEPPFPFTTAFSLAFDQSKEIVKRCYGPAQGAAPDNIPADTKTLQALHAAFTDSNHSVASAGTLSPPNLHATIRSELFTEDFGARARFAAEASYRDGALDLKVQETGTTPQIDPSGPAKAREDSAATQVVWKTAGKVAAHLRIRPADRLLQDARIAIERYPVRVLLLRIGPFLPRDTLEMLGRLSDGDTLLDLTAHAAGTLDAFGLEGRGEASVTGVRLLGMHGVSVKVPAILERDQVHLKDMRLESSAGRVDGTVLLKRSGEVSGEVSTDRFRLRDTPAAAVLPPAFRNDLSGRIAVSGSIRDPRYQGALQLTEPSATVPVLSLRLQGDAAGHKINFSGFDQKIAGDVLLDGKHLTASADIRSVSLDALIPGREQVEPESRLSGTVQYKATAGAVTRGTGAIRISEFYLKRRGHEVKNTSPLILEVKNGALDFTRFELRVADRVLTVTGGVSLDSGWAARIQGSWELGALFGGIPGIESVTGSVSGDVQVRGPFDEPGLSGHVSATNLGLSMLLGDNIVGLSDGRIEAQFAGDSMEIPLIEAKLGSGTVQGTGYGRHLLSPTEREVTVNVSYDELSIAPIDHLTITSAGELSLEVRGSQRATLRGRVDVLSALYENQVKLVRLIRALTDFFTGSAVARRRSGGSGTGSDFIAYDIELEGDRNLIIDTNVAQAELAAKLHLTGTVANPLLDGRVRAIEGVFGLGSNEFDIVSGELVFNAASGSLEPRIGLVGETTVRQRSGDEYRVQLTVQGPLSTAEVRFTSDGDLSQEEIVALFGLGADLEDLNWLTDKRQRSLVELLNPTSDLSFEDRVRGLTGFSDVKVESALSPETGEFVPRLVAKRPLVGNFGLTIESELSGQQVSTFEIDYLLTQYLTFFTGWRTTPPIRSTTQGSGSYNVGIRYRKTFPGLTIIPRNLTEESDSDSDGAER